MVHNYYINRKLKAVICMGVFVSLASLLSSQTVIQMARSGGVSLIPCTVNGLSLNFIYDTGASDVSLSLTEAGFMLKNGYLADSDFIGVQNYSDANGNIEEGVTINLKSIVIGGLVINNVKATIVRNTKAPLLLGQSALSRLGVVQQDFANNTLTIYSNTTAPKTHPVVSPIQKTDFKKSEIVILKEDGSLIKFSVIPLNRITTKPNPNIEYYWYNQDNNSLESTLGDWGGSLVNGKFQKFYANGKLEKSGFFISGVRNGEFKEWYQNGDFNFSETYQNDVKISVSIRYNRFVYDEQGNEIQSGFKIVKSNPKNDEYLNVMYYDGNNKLYRKEIGLWPKQIFEYWPNGRERRHFTLQIGTQTRIGEYVEFFDNGKVRVKGNYSKGYPSHTPVGLWRIYNGDGSIRRNIKFQQDTFINGDTTFIGTIVEEFSGKKERISSWNMRLAGDSVIYEYLEKYWNPEYLFDFRYPRLIDPYYIVWKTDEETSLMCFKLDDFSISYFRHVFEED